jgi:hypothetical protein
MRFFTRAFAGSSNAISVGYTLRARYTANLLAGWSRCQAGKIKACTCIGKDRVFLFVTRVEFQHCTGMWRNKSRMNLVGWILAAHRNHRSDDSRIFWVRKRQSILT